MHRKKCNYNLIACTNLVNSSVSITESLLLTICSVMLTCFHDIMMPTFELIKVPRTGAIVSCLKLDRIKRACRATGLHTSTNERGFFRFVMGLRKIACFPQGSPQ
jgi:hypothetical protein